MSSTPTVSSDVMDLIILIVICLLACAFLLYVLLQWMRDTKSKPAGRLATGDEGKQGDLEKSVGRK